MKLPKEIPADQTPLLNTLARRMAKFFELGAPEAFRWLGWAVAIAAVRLAAIKTESWQLEIIPWVLFVLLLGRIIWAVGLGPKETPEGEPIPVKWSGWVAAIGTVFCWVIAYQVAFSLPAKIVEAGFLPTRAEAQDLMKPPTRKDADRAAIPAAPVRVDDHPPLGERLRTLSARIDWPRGQPGAIREPRGFG